MEEAEQAGKLEPVKLGDSGNLHDLEDWVWDENEDDWTDTIECVEKNKETKRIAKLRQNAAQLKVTKKMSCFPQRF